MSQQAYKQAGVQVTPLQPLDGGLLGAVEWCVSVRGQHSSDMVNSIDIHPGLPSGGAASAPSRESVLRATQR